MRAEVVWALSCAQKNYSFASNVSLSSIFKVMFPDSKIAAAYSMSETKIRYIIQFGIGPYVLEKLIFDLKDTPFTFKFDETTNSQVKKQYDGYVQYYSKQHQQIINHYAGSLFLGHCTAEQLKDHFMAFMHKLKCDIQFLLHIGMDGPNVNLAFQRILEKELQDLHGKQILKIGTCSLHPVHTAFTKGLKELNFDFNRLACDLHFFFKYSSARREDCIV